MERDRTRIRIRIRIDKIRVKLKDPINRMPQVMNATTKRAKIKAKIKFTPISKLCKPKFKKVA